MAAQIDFRNFDADTVGTSSGFTSGTSAAFAVTATNPVSGSHAFGESSANDGHVFVYAAAVPNDQCVQFCFKAVGPNGSNETYLNAMVRCSDASGTNGYLAAHDPISGSGVLYRKTGGSFNVIGTMGSAITASVGATVFGKIEAAGSTIRCKFWVSPATEPGSWSISATDSTYTSGKVGARCGALGTPSGPASLDDFYVGDAGVTFPGPATGTVTGSGTSTIGTTQTFTLTTNLAWTGTPTLTLSGSATGTITQFSAFSGATTGTATILWTGAGTASVNATFSDSLAAGSAQSVTVSGGGATAFTLTGPSAGPANAASTVFTVTPTGGNTSGTFTPSVISGVSYTGTPLVWSGDAAAKTFTVTKTAPGTISVNGTFSSGETPPASVSYTAKATTTRTYTVQGGTAGVTTFYTIKNVDGTAFGARTSSGVTDQGGGTYSVAAAVVPADYAGSIVWDQGGAAYAIDGLSPPPSAPSYVVANTYVVIE